MGIVAWLLDSDPSIRWQAMRDLDLASAHEVAAERALVSTSGLGAKVLAAQSTEGTWPTDKTFPEMSTLRTLLLLRNMGVDPRSHAAIVAIQRVVHHVKWLMNVPSEALPKDEPIPWWQKPFFDGEVEPCINGRVVAIGAYFGVDVSPIVGRLLREQLPDGGWNCEQQSGSVRSSFHTTINVLEGLLEFQRSGGHTPVAEALHRGHEYLLSREMFKRLSTGERIEHDRKGGPAWTQYSYPSGWRYDILRGLDHLRSAGLTPDPRTTEAVALLASQRSHQGWWLLGMVHPEEPIAEPGTLEGSPSRWNTLRAMRVLKWAGVDPVGAPTRR